jgi:hypothetical protein
MKILGVPPGPIIGEILRHLLERVLDDVSLNTVETLTAMVPDIAKTLKK